MMFHVEMVVEMTVLKESPTLAIKVEQMNNLKISYLQQISYVLSTLIKPNNHYLSKSTVQLEAHKDTVSEKDTPLFQNSHSKRRDVHSWIDCCINISLQQYNNSMMNASDSNVGSCDQESSIIEEGSNNNNCSKDEYKEGQSMNSKEGGIQTESNTENTKDIHESNTVNNYDVNITTSVPAAPQDQSEQLEATNEDNVVESYDQQAMQLNVALEALESMRRLNLECEFSGSNTIEVDHDRCTYCQREELRRPRPKPSLNNGNSSIAKSESGINIGRVKLDGSRLRRFGSNMSSLFSKASSSNISDDNNMKHNHVLRQQQQLSVRVVHQYAIMEVLQLSVGIYLRRHTIHVLHVVIQHVLNTPLLDYQNNIYLFVNHVHTSSNWTS